MSGTKQDNSKYILKNMTDEDYNQNLTYLTTISSYAASECHPMPPEAIAVMISEIAKKYEEIFDIAKLDYINDENLKDTPFRIASMYINELLIGRYTKPPRIEGFPADYYHYIVNESPTDKIKNLYEILDGIERTFYSDFATGGFKTTLLNSLLSESEMILEQIRELEDEFYSENSSIQKVPLRNMVVKTVDINSLCSHHFIPFVSTDEKSSKCIIAYIPRLGSKKALLGISKLQRIADYFGRRPQLQETLNWQIKAFVSLILRSPDVMVSFHNIIHYCEKTRGVESHCGSTSSIEFTGKYTIAENRDLVFKLSENL